MLPEIEQLLILQDKDQHLRRLRTELKKMPADADAAKALEKELIAFCRSELADVKCPRSIDFREELPRHPTGKLYKRLLKDEYWKDAGRSI